MVKRGKKADLRLRQGRRSSVRSAFNALQGREQDIALIGRLIERIDRGGSTLVITGEAGTGKSALLDVPRHPAS